MKKIGLKAKILMLMALPISAFLLIAVLFINDRANTIRDGSRFQQLIGIRNHTNKVVQAIQKERGLTAGFLGSGGILFGKKLEKQRRKTDRRIVELDLFFTNIDRAHFNEWMIRKLEGARNMLQDLNGIRNKVDTTKLQLEDALSYYTKINSYFLKNINTVAHSDYHTDVSGNMVIYPFFLQSKEQAEIELAILNNVFSHGSFKGKRALYRRFLKLIDAQKNIINNFLSLADSRQKSFYHKLIATPSVRRAEAMRKVAEQGLDRDVLGVDPIEWYEAQTRKIDVLQKIDSFLMERVVGHQKETAAKPRWDILFLSLFVAGVVVLSVVLCFMLSLVINEVVRLLEEDKKRIAEAEAAVRKSEAWNTSILDSTSDGVLTMDSKGRVTEINPPMEKIFGYKSEEVVGQQVADLFVPPESRQKHIDGVLNILKMGDSPILKKRFETRSTRKDGSPVYIDVSLNTSVFGGRNYFTAFVRDITENKQAEKELSRIKSTLDQTTDCIFMFDPTTLRFFYMNKGAVEQVGYTVEELTSMTPIDIKPLFDEEKFRELIQPLLDGESPSIRFETLHRHKGGKDIPVEINLQYLSSPDEEPRFIAIVRDITERIKADAAFKRLVTAIEQVGESVMITDVSGNIIFVNHGFTQVTGYTAEEAIGQNPRLLKSGKQDEAFYKNLWQTISNGQEWQGELCNRKMDGTLYEEVGTISPVFNSSGKIINYIAVRRDVTEERRKEKQYQQAHKMEVIGVLTGGIAHDFNNILTPILGYTEILSMRLADNPAILNDLEAIKRAGLRAKDLISQILLFTRRTKADQKSVRLDSIVKEVGKLLRSALPSTIEIRRHIDRNISLTNADVTQIHTLLMNLCTNASHAMPRGGIMEICLENIGLEDFEISSGKRLTGNFVRLRVTDDGIGMDEETIKLVFDPFFTTKAVGEGTGLGLSTVFGIVEQHGGYISVHSKLEEGSTFDFYLPALAEIDSLEFAEEDKKDIRGEESILFVDDEPSIVRSSKIGLQMLGYKVSGYTSPKDALDELSGNPQQFDLVVTDETMPFMTGSKLAEFVRLLRRDLPVVISTGNYEMLTKDKMEALEIRCLIMKPYSIEELARTIRGVFDKNELDSEPKSSLP